LGRRQGSLGETGGIALARGRHKGLLARGDASGVGNLDVEIVGAADSWTKVVTVMVIFIIVGVLSSAWVGMRRCCFVSCGAHDPPLILQRRTSEQFWLGLLRPSSAAASEAWSQRLAVFFSTVLY
jgi:hypothetical protein